MLEVINNRLGIIYKREDDFTEGQLIKWVIETKILNFPYLALTVTNFPSMISPNFEFMFDYNYDQRCLRIVRTADQKVLKEVPRDVISIGDQDDDIDSVREIYAKVYFSGSKTLSILNDKTQRRIQFTFDPDKDEFRVVTCFQKFASEFDQPWDKKYHCTIWKKPLKK